MSRNDTSAMSELYQELLNFTECTVVAVSKFPSFLFDDPPRFDFVLIAFVAVVYLFVALSIVCDDYLVPAVERLCYKLGMSYDVAGATFMAASTSAPELFTSIIATLVTKGDIGLGTIVGSSVFNSLVITAACGYCVMNTGISLDWWPITRDFIWYVISLIVVSIIIINEEVYWYEGLILLLLYVVNVLTLTFDRRMQRKLRNPDSHKVPCFVPTGEVPDLVGTIDEDPQEVDEGTPFHPLDYPKESHCFNRFMWITMYPCYLLYFLTIPNCRYKRCRSSYWMELIVCGIWIGVLTYLITWMITVLGYHFFVPESVMGITFLAAGTSIPELVAGIIVTRRGYGSMSICNAISSNTFDLLVCLGLPWLLQGILHPLLRAPGESKHVIVNSSGMAYITLALFLPAAILYISFLCTRFTLGLSVATVSMVTYIAFVVLACLAELNYFGVVNSPPCVG